MHYNELKTINSIYLTTTVRLNKDLKIIRSYIDILEIKSSYELVKAKQFVIGNNAHKYGHYFEMEGKQKRTYTDYVAPSLY